MSKLTKTLTRKASATPRTANLACLVLAAGKGTRMNSERAKVLHTLLGAPMLTYPIDRARAVGANPLVAVVGYQAEEVKRMLAARYGDNGVVTVEQRDQHGTGHAVRFGLTALRGFTGTVLILCGDVPLLTEATLRALVAASQGGRGGCLAVATMKVADGAGYGRIVRAADGKVLRIVEHKDATPQERRIDEVNAGLYAAPADLLRREVPKLRSNNAQHELYLTDLVLAVSGGEGAAAVLVDAEEVAGINDRRQLVAAEATLRRRIVRRWQEVATFRDPESALVEPGVVLAVDVEIGRGVALRGQTKIGVGTTIGEGVVLTDTEVGVGVEVRPYSVGNGAVIGDGCKIGPFAHLRPGTVLEADVHLGNFVETKQTRLGRGAKANHLAYLGDATVGAGANVGAGTITCNYNGYEKRQTIIEEGAFIGSDSQLVAPVRVGKRAVVGAGSTITEDVPDGALAISRVVQRNIVGYADKQAAKYAAVKAKAALTKPARTPSKPLLE